MGSFSCASGSSASAPREMEEAARDSCAGESSFALARALVASIWASARERSGAGTGRGGRRSARWDEGRGTRAPAVRRAAARARDRSDKTAVRGAGRFRLGGQRRRARAPVRRPFLRRIFSWKERPAGSAVMRPSPLSGEAHSPTTWAPPSGTSAGS